MKIFCSSKDDARLMKIHFKDWDRIFVYHISAAKGLLSKIPKEFCNSVRRQPKF